MCDQKTALIFQGGFAFIHTEKIKNGHILGNYNKKVFCQGFFHKVKER
jgi:glutamine amidotransferase-like uncharacterized protein